MDAAGKLTAISRSFGPRAARAKGRLLDELAATPRISARDARLLGETADFVRAYPDDPRTLRAARGLIRRLPPTDRVYAYSYAVLVRLVRLFPGRLEIAWDDVEDESTLLDVLDLLVLPGEAAGLHDVRTSTRDWFAAVRTRRETTDLEVLIGLLERSALPPDVRVFLFEICDLQIRYRGPGRAAVEMPGGRTRFQKEVIDRERFPLAPIIRRPPPPATRGGRPVIDIALQALCARSLEIYPLIYANPSDVRVADCGRGLRVALIGVLPEWRSPLETLYFFLVVKNGAPVAYGPAGVFLGCCEMGINLFPEFRGGEIRHIYAQFMRVIHHRLGADYFFLTRYGMGEDNPDAIRSGAFWFYRKLGFQPTSPAVEMLACDEEARMAAEPGYRSDRRMLRRLSHTEAYFDLSGGKRRPFDFGALALAESRFVAARFSGDRRLAERRCAARLSRLLGIDRGGRELRGLATTLCMIPDLPDWSRRDKERLAAILRAKGAPSEARAARLLKAHPRLESALRGLAGGL